MRNEPIGLSLATEECSVDCGEVAGMRSLAGKQDLHRLKRKTKKINKLFFNSFKKKYPKSAAPCQKTTQDQILSKVYK